MLNQNSNQNENLYRRSHFLQQDGGGSESRGKGGTQNGHEDDSREEHGGLGNVGSGNEYSAGSSAAPSKREMDELMARMASLEAETKAMFQDIRSREDEDKTLLEVFGERMKDYIVANITPTTDKECIWSMKRARCEPKCHCGLRYKLGDYWLGRMCRLVPEHERDPGCFEDVWIPSDDPFYERIARRLQEWVQIGASHYQEQIAPPTDEECSFNWHQLQCMPEGRCHYRFRWGDISPDRSCRLKHSNQDQRRDEL